MDFCMQKSPSICKMEGIRLKHQKGEGTVNNRQRGILLRLVATDKAVTSEQLARELGVSSRTIKTDMAVIVPELEQNGARLVAQRNRGYSLEIIDPPLFRTLYTMSRFRVDMIAAADEEGRIIHVARKLVASEGGVLVDEVAEQMYLSRGAIRGALQEALAFCQSYRLHTASAPGQGLRVEGEEYQLRMAMTELFGVHFHQAQPSPGDEEYARWIACDYQERQDIRHVFLKILRESPYAVRDSVSQRLSMYLILARNRRRAGFYLELPARWIREVRELPVFELAKKIYGELSRQFRDYNMDTVEIAFLALMLLTNLDADLTRDPAVTAPFLVPVALEVSGAMLERLRADWGVDLSRLPDAQPLLIQTILPMLARTRYQMDGAELFNWGVENQYLNLPVEACCARAMAQELISRGCRVNHIDIATLACFMVGLLQRVEYPIKPLRLLATNAIGGEFARLSGIRLRDRWPELVESVTPVELYAVRALEWPRDYDAILLGHVSDEPGANFAYTYDAPACPLSLVRQGSDYGRIYNTLLIDAYQFDKVLPPERYFHVWENFHYYDKEQALQFMAAQYGRDNAGAQKIRSRLERREKQLTMARGQIAVIFAEPGLCREPCMDLYCLTKPGKWGEWTIRWILFASFTWRELPNLKAMAAVMAKFTKNTARIEQFAKAPRQTLLEILRESVQFA